MPLIGPVGNLTDPVAGALSGSLQSISGDIWILANATWDGADFHRIDMTKAAYGYQIQGQGFIPGEPDLGFLVSGATMWVAQPESYTLIRATGSPTGAVFGAVGGWELGWTLSQQRQMTIGGGGLEIDGYGTTPFTRVTANTTGSVLSRHIGGMVRNAFTALDGADDLTKESWFWGYVDQFTTDPTTFTPGTNHWTVAYMPASTIPFGGVFHEWLTVSPAGVVEVSADPTTDLGVATKQYVDNAGGGGGGTSAVNSITTSGTNNYTLAAATYGAFNITLGTSSVPTFIFTGATSGEDVSFTAVLTQPSGGGVTVTWPSSGLTWIGGTVPVLNTGTSAVSVFVFESVDGSNWIGSMVTGPEGNGAATTAVSITTGAGESTIASATIPANLPAGATYRITAYGTITVGGTGGTTLMKTRLGGLSGTQVQTFTTASLTSSSTYNFRAVAEVTLQSPGSSGTWAGDLEAAQNVQGSAASVYLANPGTATVNSTTAQVFALTLTLSSATATASCTGSVWERVA